jgi:hypothetical protein
LLERSLAILLLGTVGTAAGAQTQSLVPAAPAEIAAAVGTCVAATKPAGADAGVLAAQGWKKATATSASGKPLATPFSVYGREGGKTLITVSKAKKRGDLCTVMARIESTDTAKPVVEALSAELKAKPGKIEQSEVYWFAGRKVVQLASTGDRSKPSVRISVMQLPEKSK